MKASDYYVLAVRYPTGGIRTHLKYSRQLLNPDGRILRPVLVCPDDEEGRALAQMLELEPEFFCSAGAKTVRDLAAASFRAARRFGAKVIHSHGFTAAVASAPAAHLPGRRHVVTVHDVVTRGVIEHTSAAELWGLGLVLRRAYAVHAPGQGCAQSVRLLPLMARAPNVRIIPHGINPTQFADVVPANLRETLGLERNSYVVGFFGRFMAPKGFRVLVDAVRLVVARNPAIPLVVIAVGSGGFIREDKAYVHQLGLASHFRFLDFVENPAPVMAGVDVVAMPSKWEAYGLVAAEVLALGVPLIASTCVGLREVIEDTPARKFDSGDASGLADQLLAEYGDSTRALAQEFAPGALKRFDFTRGAKAIQDLLQEANAS